MRFLLETNNCSNGVSRFKDPDYKYILIKWGQLILKAPIEFKFNNIRASY